MHILQDSSIKRACAHASSYIGSLWAPILLVLLLVWPAAVWAANNLPEKNGNEEEKPLKAGLKEEAKEAAAETKKKETAPGRTVSRETFEKLPRAKGLESILQVLPGVQWDTPYGAPSMDGASAPENRYLVEGVDTTTHLAGERGVRVHTDFIESVKVSSPGADASMGGYTGGAAEVVIREGGNQFHGSVGMYYEGSALEGKPRPEVVLTWDDIAKYVTYGEDTRNTFEPVFTLGGYIIKDRLWFFSGFSPTFTTIKRDGAERLREFIGHGFNDGFDMDAYHFTRKERRYNGTLKLTGQLSEHLRVSAHGVLDVSRWQGDLPGVNNMPEASEETAGHGFRFPRFSLGANIEYAVSDNFRVRADLGYFSRDQREFGGPGGVVKAHNTTNANIPGIPPDLIVPAGWHSGLWSVIDRVIKNKETSLSTGFHLDLDFDLGGRHALAAGFRAVRNSIDKDVGQAEDIYIFYWDRDWEGSGGGHYTPELGYVEVRDPYGYKYDNHTNGYQVYISDTWTLGRFSLTLGVRAGQQDILTFVEGYSPQVRFGFDDTVAPRAAFNWSPLQDGTLRVFGSFGIYYDTVKMDWAEKHFGGFRWLSHYYEIGDWDWKNAYYEMEHPQTDGLAGGAYLETQNFDNPVLDVVDPNLKPMGKREVTLGFSKELGTAWTASATFVYHSLFNPIEKMSFWRPGWYQEDFIIVNPGSDWAREQFAQQVAGGASPQGAELQKAKRTYTAVTLRLDKKFSDRWLGGLSYTWSKLRGNYDGLRPDNYSPWALRGGFNSWYCTYTQANEPVDGPLALDRPHTFKVYGAYAFDFGLTLGFSGYGMSGAPLQTKVLLNEAQVFYPLGRGGEGRLPFLWQLDLYAEYNLRLSDRLTLQFNAGVSNVTDNDMARQQHMFYNSRSLFLSEQTIEGGFDYAQVIAEKNVERDPRYGMEYDYLNSIAARLGVKLIF